MTNPLSDEGVSDRDFAAAVGIAMGETGSRRISKEEMAAVIDVAVNRLERFDVQPNHYRADERSLAGIIEARGQFDASNRRGSRGGQQNYRAGVNAIMNGAPVPSNMRARYDAAIKQAIGVLSKDGPLRGTARNADYFSSTAKKLSGKEARTHAKLGKGTGTKIGASTFYGPEHTKQYGKRDAPVPARREAEYSKFGQSGTPRENLSQPFSTEDYSQFGQFGTPREAIAPSYYSPAALDFGPDFTSPPSQARGAVSDPYGFSNINTAAEATRGSFSGYGPNAFAALDQAPVDYGRTYPELSAGLYPDVAAPGSWISDEAAFRGRMSDLLAPEMPASPAPMTNEDFNAIFGDVPFSEATGATGSSRGARSMPAGQVSAINPYGFSGMTSWAPAPDAATIPDDVTGYGPGGAFGARAGSPAFDFADIVNGTFGPYQAGADIPATSAQPSAAPMTTVDRPEAPVETGRTYPDISAGLYGGPTVTASTSPFSPSALGPATGFRDYGNYDIVNNPVGYSAMEFSHSPNVPAPSQAPSRGITGYESKTITRDVPNPAWSDWSRDYGTKNALQDAWLAADEDKFGVDRGLVSRPSAVTPVEPPRTIERTSIQRSPVYGDLASRPAARAAPVQAPMRAAPAVAAPVAAPVVSAPVAGGWWDSFTSGLGNIFGGGGGMSLAGLGNYSGYGNFGGAYDPGGYGGGGYGGTAPGDAGYGSDARSGTGNMGAGNLYA